MKELQDTSKSLEILAGAIQTESQKKGKSTLHEIAKQGKTFKVEDTDEDSYTEVDLYDDEEAFLYENELSFSKDEDDNLQLMWQGKIDDFYTGSDEPLLFRMKCHFKQDDIEIED